MNPRAWPLYTDLGNWKLSRFRRRCWLSQGSLSDRVCLNVSPMIRACPWLMNVLYTGPVRVVFSCENTTYHWWQAEFLRYTYVQAGMHAELTALVAATEEPEIAFSCNSVRVANYKDSVPNAPLLVLNKPGGIAEWAALDGPGRMKRS